MGPGVANRGAGNRGRLCRGQGHDCRAARPVGEAEAALSVEAACPADACPMDRAGVRQSSARESCAGSQVLQSREQGHSGVDAASATVGTSSSAGLFW